MADNYITCPGDKGNINISEDVIVAVVRNAITEIEGVAGLANTAGTDLAELLGIKTLSKGVTVRFVNDTVVVDAIILVKYGSNIVEVAKKVQDAIVDTVQASTGIGKAEVNVHDRQTHRFCQDRAGRCLRRYRLSLRAGGFSGPPQEVIFTL